MNIIHTAAVVLPTILNLLPLNITNVYQYLWRHYGASITRLYGESVKIRCKLYKLRSDVVFIQSCRREGLIPTFASIRLSNPDLRGTKLVQQCAQHILQAEKKLKKRMLTRAHRQAKRLSEAVSRSVPDLIFTRLQSICDQIVEKRMKEVQSRHESKLQKLRPTKLSSLGHRKPVLDPVTNLSSRTLTMDERNALAHGLHHVYPCDKFDQPRFVCNVEYFYSRTRSTMSITSRNQPRKRSSTRCHPHNWTPLRSCVPLPTRSYVKHNSNSNHSKSNTRK